MKTLRLAMLAIALGLACSAASAVEIQPLSTIRAPNENAGTMRMHNTSATEKTYQLTVFELSIVDGKQVRTPSKSLRFAPSVITMPPGQIQVVRWVRTGDGAKTEVIYRIHAHEVPGPIVGTKSGVYPTIDTDFPWIWRQAGAKPALTARWEKGDLLVKNTGNATAQLAALTAGKISKPGLVGYVLPGEEGRFALKATDAPATVTVNINGEPKTLDAR